MITNNITANVKKAKEKCVVAIIDTNKKKPADSWRNLNKLLPSHVDSLPNETILDGILEKRLCDFCKIQPLFYKQYRTTNS